MQGSARKTQTKEPERNGDALLQLGKFGANMLFGTKHKKFLTKVFLVAAACCKPLCCEHKPLWEEVVERRRQRLVGDKLAKLFD